MVTVHIQARTIEGHWENIAIGEVYAVRPQAQSMPGDGATQAFAHRVSSSGERAAKIISSYAPHALAKPPSLGQNIDLYC
jgi:hypothetical protein